jgi:hypothetical protein
MLSDIQAREAFHFTLLRRLVEQLPQGVRLKGGVNLRLFFGSVRYSEDMDLDADARLQPRVLGQLRQIIAAPAFRRELLQLGIEDVTTSSRPAKSTDTTLRLKVAIVKGGVPLPTKVEVSFRGTSPGAWAVNDVPDPNVLTPYFPDGVPRFEVPHYPHQIAVWQKVNALATRGGVQARDIFDLHWLFDAQRFGTPTPAVLQFLRDRHPLAKLHTARDRCVEIRDAQFQEQVGAYLEPATRAHFEPLWDDMRLLVHGLLETAIALPVSSAPPAPVHLTPATPPKTARRSR